jgi:hypothetical protein
MGKIAPKKTGTKKQKKQQADAGPAARIGSNINLREAGRKLQKLMPNESISNSNAYNVLLKKLKAGELSAGFFVTSDEKSWIEIPRDYWRHIGENIFSSILKNRSQPGAYKIKPRDFPTAIAAAFVENAIAAPEAATQALTSFMNAGASGYDPEIPILVWQKFLEKNDVSDPAAKTVKRGSGKTESLEWFDLAAHLMGYCLAKKGTIKTKRKGIHKLVVELAKKNGIDVGGWPGESSARDFLKVAWDFAKDLERQHKA